MGTVIGSYCGYLFSQQSPDGLGFISMATTVFLGIKFLLKPITGGQDAASSVDQSGRKTSLAMLLGRLEIFPMLILFMPSTWEKHS